MLKGQHTMLLQSIFSHILIFLNKIHLSKTYGSDLERYIVSKHPNSTHEVEYWAQQYDKQISREGVLS
jgi:hypothetical protein